jgi:UDP-N-acetylmuramyl pentapeptide phosphotransferase/UDP-N-acetylglucosamine-1-phosphate transferase
MAAETVSLSAALRRRAGQTAASPSVAPGVAHRDRLYRIPRYVGVIAVLALLVTSAFAPSAVTRAAVGIAVVGALIGLPHGAVDHVVGARHAGGRTPGRGGRTRPAGRAFTFVHPFAAFGVYFGLWHALRHTARLVDLASGGGAARTGVRRVAAQATLPTAGALAVLAGVWVTARLAGRRRPVPRRCWRPNS